MIEERLSGEPCGTPKPCPASAFGVRRVPVPARVQGFTAGGDTALYDAVRAAYEIAAADPAPITSIVLFTNGEREGGSPDLAGFKEYFDTLDPGRPKPPTVTTAHGEANTAEMQELAEHTGGITIDARNIPLSDAFTTIRRQL